MSDSVLEKALKERERLLKELESDRRFQRLQKLSEFISMYEELQSDKLQLPANTVIRKGSQFRRIEEAVKQVLQEQQPLQTRAILDRLAQHDVEIVGQKPISMLSSILSRSKEFELAEGRLGWRIKTKAIQILDNIKEVKIIRGKTEASPDQTGEAPIEK